MNKLLSALFAWGCVSVASIAIFQGQGSFLPLIAPVGLGAILLAWLFSPPQSSRVSINPQASNLNPKPAELTIKRPPLIEQRWDPEPALTTYESAEPESSWTTCDPDDGKEVYSQHLGDTELTISVVFKNTKSPSELPTAWQGWGAPSNLVVGESHYEKAFRSLTKGKLNREKRVLFPVTVTFERDRDNAHDPHAIRASVNGLKVGHFPGVETKWLAPLMDEYGECTFNLPGVIDAFMFTGSGRGFACHVWHRECDDSRRWIKGAMSRLGGYALDRWPPQEFRVGDLQLGKSVVNHDQFPKNSAEENSPP